MQLVGLARDGVTLPVKEPRRDLEAERVLDDSDDLVDLLLGQSTGPGVGGGTIAAGSEESTVSRGRPRQPLRESVPLTGLQFWP